MNEKEKKTVTRGSDRDGMIRRGTQPQKVYVQKLTSCYCVRKCK